MITSRASVSFAIVQVLLDLFSPFLVIHYSFFCKTKVSVHLRGKMESHICTSAFLLACAELIVTEEENL